MAHQLVPRVSYYLSRVGSDEEVALCELGLRCAMVLGSDREVGAAANNLGIAHGRRGRYEAAMTAFRTSLEHCIRADHRLGASRAQSNIALVLDRTGHTAEAASLLEVLLADLAEWAEPEEALNDLNTLANCYTHLGRHPDALRTAHRLQEVAETLHSPLHLGLAEDAIGSAYLDLGQPEEACEALERARQLYLDTGDPAAGPGPAETSAWRTSRPGGPSVPGRSGSTACASSTPWAPRTVVPSPARRCCTCWRTCRRDSEAEAVAQGPEGCRVTADSRGLSMRTAACELPPAVLPRVSRPGRARGPPVPGIRGEATPGAPPSPAPPG